MLAAQWIRRPKRNYVTLARVSRRLERGRQTYCEPMVGHPKTIATGNSSENLAITASIK